MTPTSRAAIVAVAVACATLAARPNASTGISSTAHAHAVSTAVVAVATGSALPVGGAVLGAGDASLPSRLALSVLSLGGLGLYLGWRTRRHA